MDMEKPKYQQLIDYIIETIQSGKIQVNEKIYSEYELAETFGISRNTVRQAIGELVNEGWLYRIQGKGTFVHAPKEETVERLRTVAVVTTYLSDYIFPSIIRGIDRVLSTNGYSMMLSCTYNQHQKERLCLENLLIQNISALIVEPTRSALPNPNIDLYEKFHALGVPVLFIHGTYRELQASFIVEDDAAAGYIATEHLIHLGHKKVAGIFKIDDIQGHLRFSGFQKAHAEAGLQVLDDKIMWFTTGDLESRLKDSNYLKEFLKDCTALVCYNDQLALKIIDLLRESDIKIPEDLSLVSFDDSQLALASEIKLTSVSHPKETLGEESAKVIIQMIQNNQAFYNLKLIPELVVRNSTQNNY